MDDNRIFFIGNTIYKGNSAEEKLKESICELKSIQKHMTEQIRGISEYLDKHEAETNDFVSSYVSFIELGEAISFSTIILEDLIDFLHTRGF